MGFLVQNHYPFNSISHAMHGKSADNNDSIEHGH